ncbi:MAG: helix-turn-helix domain-containing protein [Oscillospiraceae bacterium]|jgi:transcriptional regulator with XRE-family HTH domain|nr:helix-turn-helix domain-containing protein [Oscillospiraceae bacterium]
MATTAQILRTLRTDARQTQAQLAESLHVTPQAVSKWETGASMPDVALLPQIAALFGVSVDYLLGRDALSEAIVSSPPPLLDKRAFTRKLGNTALITLIIAGVLTLAWTLVSGLLSRETNGLQNFSAGILGSLVTASALVLLLSPDARDEKHGLFLLLVSAGFDIAASLGHYFVTRAFAHTDGAILDTYTVPLNFDPTVIAILFLWLCFRQKKTITFNKQLLCVGILYALLSLARVSILSGQNPLYAHFGWELLLFTLQDVLRIVPVLLAAGVIGGMKPAQTLLPCRGGAKVWAVIALVGNYLLALYWLALALGDGSVSGFSGADMLYPCAALCIAYALLLSHKRSGLLLLRAVGWYYLVNTLLRMLAQAYFSVQANPPHTTAPFYVLSVFVLYPLAFLLPMAINMAVTQRIAKRSVVPLSCDDR